MQSRIVSVLVTVLSLSVLRAADPAKKYNVLFIISDDLTYTALSCYGNKVCQTPNIDKLAAEGTRFTQAYCQGTYCGPSRASFMSGYYPHATEALDTRARALRLATAARGPNTFEITDIMRQG